MKKENSMKLKCVRLLLVSLLIGIISVGCESSVFEQENKGNATLIIKTIGAAKTERFKFRGGTPLGILKYNHTVKTILNDNFIECIDSVCADGRYIWLLYVNDKTINYGAKRYRLKDNDIIVFEFSESRKTNNR